MPLNHQIKCCLKSIHLEISDQGERFHDMEGQVGLRGMAKPFIESELAFLVIRRR